MSQSRKNPFAKKSSIEPESSPRGLAVFDQPATKVTTKSTKENQKSKATKQPTLFGMKKTVKDVVVVTQEESQEPTASPAPKSGFILWLDHNKPQLKLDNPDATDAELVRIGAQKFKTLSEEERQV